MTLGAYRLDSEFDGLLREAAKDPDSAFFRGAPPGVVHRLTFAKGPLRPSLSTLAALDRQQLFVQRHELATLLAEAALQTFVRGRGGARMLLFRNPRKALAPGSPESSRSRILATLEHGAACAHPRGWLAEWLAGRAAPSVAALVALSQELAPNPRIAVLGALDAALAGELRSARETLHAVLERYPDDGSRGRAHEGLALVHGRQGDLAGALRHLRAAHELEPRRGHALLSWFCCALVCGDECAQLAADKELETRVQPDSDFLRQALKLLAALARAGRATARFGPVGRALLEALAAGAGAEGAGDPILVGPPGSAF